MNKKALEGIYDKFSHYIDVPQALTDILSVNNPGLSAGISILSSIFHKLEVKKLDSILKGLARNDYTEADLWKLNNYINNSDKAFFVSESLRKVLLGSSNVACLLMGILLSDLVEENREIKSEDHILANALYEVNDDDIFLFEDMYINYMITGRDQTRWIRLDTEPNRDKRLALRLAEEYFAQKRILLQNHELFPGSATLGDAFAEVTQITDRLYKYIQTAKPLLNKIGFNK